MATTLTGQTVRIEAGTLLPTGAKVTEAFEAEVQSTWFNLRNQVEAIEVCLPGRRSRVAIWSGWSLAA